LHQKWTKTHRSTSICKFKNFPGDDTRGPPLKREANREGGQKKGGECLLLREGKERRQGRKKGRKGRGRGAFR